jgi:hypothetical protein
MLEHFPRDVSGDLHDRSRADPGEAPRSRLIARAAFRNVSLSTSTGSKAMGLGGDFAICDDLNSADETACMQPPDWFSNTSAWERSSLSLNLSRNRF